MHIFKPHKNIITNFTTNNVENYYPFSLRVLTTVNQLKTADQYDRIIAIGDIHGNYDRLMSLLSKVNLTSKDLVIFLGDYTDRGSNNFACMQFLIQLSDYRNVVFLTGNHEFMLLQHIIINARKRLNKHIRIDDFKTMDIDEFTDIFNAIFTSRYDKYYAYLPNGGYETLSEFVDKDRVAVKDKLTILQKYLYTIGNLESSLQLNINGQETFFVHAGINPKKSLAEQTLDDLIWIRDEFLDYYNGDMRIVIGHTPTQKINRKAFPITFNNIVMMDTGSYVFDGKISAIDVKTNHIWQS